MRTKSRKVLNGAAVAGVLALSLGAALPAMGAEQGEAEAVRSELISAVPELGAALAPATETVATDSGVTAEITEDTISISSERGAFTATAPEDTTASSVHSMLLDEASALFAIRLSDETAPRSYDFEVELPAGATAEMTEEGAVLYRNVEGDFLGGVAVPWAKDAAGMDIPTSFTFANGTLTQRVDLDAVENVTYPVIADPLYGQWLVSAAWITYQSNPDRYVVNATPTEFGRQYSQVQFLGQHSADLRSRLGTNASQVTSTIENQFHCHVLGNAFGGGETYNMESWRPDVWYWVQAAVGCNP